MHSTCRGIGVREYGALSWIIFSECYRKWEPPPRRMAVKHYAHQYTMQLTDEKIADGNVSSENSDVEDYYPLIHRSVNGVMANAEARRRAKEGWETVRFYFNIFVHVFCSLGINLFFVIRILSGAKIRAFGAFLASSRLKFESGAIDLSYCSRTR